MSVQAYILIQTEVGKAGDVAHQVRELDGVDGGRRRHRALRRHRQGRGRDHGRAGPDGVSKVQMIDGITRTLTCPVVNL